MSNNRSNICTAPECENPSIARQLCKKHWAQWRRVQPDRPEFLRKQREQNRKSKDRHMRSRYGITGKQYDDLYRSQFCKCAICNVDLHHVWTDAKKETKAYVDHDHATGKVRGLLCFHCNVGLGSFGDSIENLISAMAYLSAAVSKSESRR